ncbi:TPA: hypothetical protein ACSPDU_002360, partial [Staphylococcus aureus]
TKYLKKIKVKNKKNKKINLSKSFLGIKVPLTFIHKVMSIRESATTFIFWQTHNVVNSAVPSYFS